MKKSIVIVAFLISIAHATDKKENFYVYNDAGSKRNHFIPSGWMGDFGDMKVNTGLKGGIMNSKYPAERPSCIEIKYSAERKQGNGWAGIYWQHPANNWGDKDGGFDLTPYKKMVFMVKGANGGEYLDKFFVGGITGQTKDGDSDQENSDSIELSKEWKEVVIDLKGIDLSHIIGGFGFALNADMNPKGATFYLDEIRFEK